MEASTVAVKTVNKILWRAQQTSFESTKPQGTEDQANADIVLKKPEIQQILLGIST